MTTSTQSTAPNRNRSRLWSAAQIVIFDIAGPLVAYQMLRSAGLSSVFGPGPERRAARRGRAGRPHPAPAPGCGRRPGARRDRRRHGPRPGQRQRPPGAGRRLGAHRGVRPAVPGLAAVPPPADLPLRPGVHGPGHPARPGLRRPLAVLRIPPRLPGLHGGLGRDLPGRSRSPDRHRRDHLDRHRAGRLQGDALRRRPASWPCGWSSTAAAPAAKASASPPKPPPAKPPPKPSPASEAATLPSPPGEPLPNENKPSAAHPAWCRR